MGIRSAHRRHNGRLGRGVESGVKLDQNTRCLVLREGAESAVLDNWEIELDRPDCDKRAIWRRYTWSRQEHRIVRVELIPIYTDLAAQDELETANAGRDACLPGDHSAITRLHRHLH